MINHRGPEFAAMLDRILDRHASRTSGRPATSRSITTAGTGGLEAAVVNTLSPGDRVLGVSIGSFGDRFAKIARTYGADVTKIEVEWGQAADPAVLRAELERAPGYKAVLLTHNETSTGGHEPDRATLAAVVREARAGRAHPRRQRVRARRRAVRDGRLGRRRRRHRLAEGLDVRARPGHDRRLASAPGRRWRRRPRRASTSTCGRTARATPTARRRGPRPSPSSTRSTRASG